jgi:hypothetical protein
MTDDRSSGTEVLRRQCGSLTRRIEKSCIPDGILQADGYAGFDKLYNDADPRISITRSKKRHAGRI